jgi:hypothetical protein
MANKGELGEYYALLSITKEKRIQLLSSKGNTVDCPVNAIFFGDEEKTFS